MEDFHTSKTSGERRNINKDDDNLFCLKTFIISREKSTGD